MSRLKRTHIPVRIVRFLTPCLRMRTIFAIRCEGFAPCRVDDCGGVGTFCKQRRFCDKTKKLFQSLGVTPKVVELDKIGKRPAHVAHVPECGPELGLSVGFEHCDGTGGGFDLYIATGLVVVLTCTMRRESLWF